MPYFCAVCRYHAVEDGWIAAIGFTDTERLVEPYASTGSATDIKPTSSESGPQSDSKSTQMGVAMAENWIS